MTESNKSTQADGNRAGSKSGKDAKSYLRFISMIVTAMVVMYATTYMNTFELSHVAFSETRVFMTLLMGATMALVMLAYMLGMYRNWKANVAIVLGAIVLFGLATWLVRSQTTVQEASYMRAMIPHHSIAILTSERSEIEDVRVCELAVEIIEAQRREIAEMDWLIADIEENGPAATRSDADQRPVPTFQGTSVRTCG
jgi:hypothetical protein